MGLLVSRVLAVDLGGLFEGRYPRADRAAGTDVSAVRVHEPIYKDMQRFMPGGVFLCNGKVHALQGSLDRHNGTPDYFVDVYRNKSNTKRCKFLQQNCGLCRV